MPARLDPRRSPTFYLKVQRQGRANAERIDVATTRVTNLVIKDSETVADKITMTIDNRDLSNFENPIFADGNIIEFSFGYPGAMSPPRRATITKVTGSLVLAVEALGKKALMNVLQKTRTFENMRRSEVAAIIADENGFGADGNTDIDETPAVIPLIVQARMTDANLLQAMARKEGFQWYEDATGFHFHERRLGQKPRRTYVFFVDPGMGDIIDWKLATDITAKPAAVTHKGFDPLKKERISERADADTTRGRPGLAPVSKVLLISKLGAKSLTTSEVTVATTAKTAQDAAAQAAGAAKLSQMGAVRLNVDLVGDPYLRAKEVVRLEGISSVLSGNYYIVDVEHKPGHGFTSHMTVRRDGTSKGGTAATASTAKVNDAKAPADPNAPVPRKVVDQKTGATHTEYHVLGQTKGTS